MPSFDVVSKLEWSEVMNALGQAQKEVGQRFDFRGTDTSIERTEEGLVLRANTEDRARAALGVLEEKLVRRKVSLKHFDKQKPEVGPKGTSRILVKVKEGIEAEKAREIIKMVKESKLRLQASIQEQAVRISGKKRDELQTMILHLKAADHLDLDLQFINFRE
jgi:cyclic-di-GMP-binding protein